MLNSIKQNKKVESTEKNQTEVSLNQQTFDYYEKLLLIINDLTDKTETLFKQGKPTTITYEMIDNQHADYFSKIEEKIHVEAEEIINYLDKCIKWVSYNQSSYEDINLVFNYGSASKSIFNDIKNDISRMIICDEGVAKEISPSSSYFEIIYNQTKASATVAQLLDFFESEKSILKEMNKVDLISLLNYIVGFNWRSSKQFELNKRSELNN